MEAATLDGQKIPDWHNLCQVHAFLRSRDALDEFPLLRSIHAVAFEAATPATILGALRAPAAASTERFGPLSIDFRGQRCLVTGAAGGIGSAIVAGLLRCNARIVAVDSSEGGLAALCAGHSGSAERIVPLVADLANIDETNARIHHVIDKGGPIQLLVNCAGVAKFEPYLETQESEFLRQYSINLKPCIFLTQEIAKTLIERGLPGSVVHISSQSSTLPILDHLIYSSSKAAVDHAMRIQAFELGKHGIRVNTVRPTVVLTELVTKAWDPEKLAAMKAQVPLARLARPDEVAHAVAWLLSDLAAMVTGVDLAVDGGRSMGGHGL